MSREHVCMQLLQDATCIHIHAHARVLGFLGQSGPNLFVGPREWSVRRTITTDSARDWARPLCLCARLGSVSVLVPITCSMSLITDSTSRSGKGE